MGWAFCGSKSFFLVANQCILPLCIIPVSALRTLGVTLFGRWKPAPAIRDMFRSNFPTILVGIDISGTDHVRMGWLIRSLTFILSRLHSIICFSGMCQESTSELGLVSLLVKCLEMSSCPSLSSLATRQLRTKCILALSICVEQCGKHVLTVKVLLYLRAPNAP